jgi:hypothetical protein
MLVSRATVSAVKLLRAQMELVRNVDLSLANSILIACCVYVFTADKVEQDIARAMPRPDGE